MPEHLDLESAKEVTTGTHWRSTNGHVLAGVYMIFFAEGQVVPRFAAMIDAFADGMSPRVSSNFGFGHDLHRLACRSNNGEYASI